MCFVKAPVKSKITIWSAIEIKTVRFIAKAAVQTGGFAVINGLPPVLLSKLYKLKWCKSCFLYVGLKQLFFTFSPSYGSILHFLWIFTPFAKTILVPTFYIDFVFSYKISIFPPKTHFFPYSFHKSLDKHYFENKTVIFYQTVNDKKQLKPPYFFHKAGWLHVYYRYHILLAP